MYNIHSTSNSLAENREPSLWRKKLQVDGEVIRYDEIDIDKT